MNPAALSLAALVAAIVLSCVTPVHVGLLAAAAAFVIGIFVAGMKPQAVAAGFPVALFLTLAGITLLFSMAQANGTLEQIARRGVRLARGNRGVIPIVFFALALGLGAAGPGGIAAAALLAPVAMPVAAECGIPPLLMIVMLANGANAGTFSPLAPTGIIARDLMQRIGLEAVAWPNFWNTLLAQSLVAAAGFIVLGGFRLFAAAPAGPASAGDARIAPFTAPQKLTLAVIAAFAVAVAAFGLDAGMAALVGASILSVARAADEEQVWRGAPWSVLFLVCGVTMLVAIAEKTGGMDLFTSLLARLATPSTIPGLMALVTGLVSVYSSSSGVVMPAFLPTIPGLVEKLGGGNPLMIAYSVNVGAHLVDVSPLSTIGALCLAGVPASEDRHRVFRQLLIWGWAMSLAGAVVCQLLFGYR
ncbi:MAG: C4-dicarboxylate ABC transporter [Bryobacterales bacterium]|nr:C4-dicarboxylate ABC transporter [Bryobacterales bacterium]